MSEEVGSGGVFREAQDEEQAKPTAAQRPSQEAEADLDALFREALADGEVTGDVVAVDAQGREVAGRRRSNIFDA